MLKNNVLYCSCNFLIGQHSILISKPTLSCLLLFCFPQISSPNTNHWLFFHRLDEWYFQVALGIQTSQFYFIIILFCFISPRSFLLGVLVILSVENNATPNRYLDPVWLLHWTLWKVGMIFKWVQITNNVVQSMSTWKALPAVIDPFYLYQLNQKLFCHASEMNEITSVRGNRRLWLE